MNKIKVKNDIINLDCAIRVTVTSTIIGIELSHGCLIQYEPGEGLSQAEFDTLSAWLLNAINHAYVVVVV